MTIPTSLAARASASLRSAFSQDLPPARSTRLYPLEGGSSDRPRRTLPWAVRVRRVVACGACLALGVSISACEIHLGSPTPTALPSLSTQQADRDAVARQVVLISSIAQHLGDDPSSGLASLASDITADAEAQLTVVGGLWDPWPSGAPSDAPTAAPVATASSQVTATDLLSQLASGVTLARDAAIQASGQEAGMYVSLAVAWAWRAQELASTLKVEVPESCKGTARAASSMTTPLPAQLLRSYDAARYALEEVAARGEGDVYKRAYADATDATSIVNASLALGGEDSRLAAYAPPSAEANADQNLDIMWARRVWKTVAEQEIVASISLSGTQRSQACDAAIDAAARAFAWGQGLPSALPAFLNE